MASQSSEKLNIRCLEPRRLTGMCLSRIHTFGHVLIDKSLMLFILNPAIFFQQLLHLRVCLQLKSSVRSNECNIRGRDGSSVKFTFKPPETYNLRTIKITGQKGVRSTSIV